MSMHTHLLQISFGDDTPRLQGRLNLNPISHIDPIGFIMLIVAHIGWGKPVQIDPRNFKGKYSLSKAEAIVAAAGPIMNFILAFIFTILFYVLFIVTNVVQSLTDQWQIVLQDIVYDAVLINIGLGIFNLIPLPPLDGSKILMHFLSAKGKKWFVENQYVFYIAFLIIWITGLSSVIIDPLLVAVVNGFDWIVRNIFELMGLL